MINTLWVYEIYRGINGEVNRYGQGSITTFLRLAGCNCQCPYCDTKQAWETGNGEEMETKKVIEEVLSFGTDLVTITGGEPLLQSISLLPLVVKLVTEGKEIIIETNGTICPNEVLIRIVYSWVMDWKLPSSNAHHLMNAQNFAFLEDEDFVKFIISNEEDYEYMKQDIKLIREDGCMAKFAISLNWDSPFCGYNGLVDRLIEDGLQDMIINIQLHKYIGAR